MSALCPLPEFETHRPVFITVWPHPPGSMNRDEGEMHRAAHGLAQRALGGLDVTYRLAVNFDADLFAEVHWVAPDAMKHVVRVHHTADRITQLRTVVQRALRELGR